MEMKVQQGLNFESATTTITAHFDATPKTELIDLVQSFHPVFLEDYSVNENIVSLKSKLPHLWKEILIALNYLSNGDWSETITKDYILNNVIKKQILSMSTIPILYYAHQAGYETTQFFIEEGITPVDVVASKLNRYYAVGAGAESQVVISIASSKDTYLAKMIQNDKSLTNGIFDRLKLPIAKWEAFDTKEELKDIFNKYKKPVVIKPSSLTGGHGVTTKIETLEQAYNAFDRAAESFDRVSRSRFEKRIMIQEQVYGEDYRLLVINGELKIATKRIPAFVIGDGVKTIEELIKITNTDPRRNVSDPSHILKPINFDEPLEEYLKEQNLDLNYIPKKEEKVYVRKVASMSQGGITEDFTKQVHPQIKQVVESLAASIHVYALGVDVMCKSLSEPLTTDNGSIIECNTMPEAYLNAFPVIGDQYPDIGKWVVEGLIDTKNPTKKVVYIGKDVTKLKSYLKMNLSNFSKEKIGILSENSIYINDELITSDLETWRAVEALKLNASLSTIAFHYSSINQVKEVGLGFDRIDQLLVDSDINVNIFEGYKNLGLINKIEVI